MKDNRIYFNIKKIAKQVRIFTFEQEIGTIEKPISKVPSALSEKNYQTALYLNGSLRRRSKYC